MKSEPQPELPDLERPRSLSIPGRELPGAVARIQEQGGIVEALDVTMSTYTLTIRWPL